MKKTFFLLSLILLLANSSYGQSSKKVHVFKKIEDRIIDTIVHLPEVQKRMDYVEIHSKRKRHLQFMIDRLTKQPHCYSVEVQEDNGDMLHTHFNFYVYNYNGKLSIKFLDTSNDDAILSLDQWRRSKFHPKE